jgi:polyhydroxyalkanoate synthesis regulator phasin
MSNPSDSEKLDALWFANLVSMLGTSALQQMGKLVNPMTKKAEIHLDGAQMSIDMLEMLQRKTQGNLAAQEKRMLDDLVSTLQMNYVEVAAEHPDAAASATDSPGGEQTQEPGPEAPPSEPAPAGQAPAAEAGSRKSEDARKFHKSYGA